MGALGTLGSLFSRARRAAGVLFVTTGVVALTAAGSVATAGTAEASPPTPAAWFGSPLAATWPTEDGCAGATYPSDTCSLPATHHIVYLSANGEVGDWAADLQNVEAGQQVKLYVAPQDPGTPITTRVERIDSACSPGGASAGSVVVVGIFSGETKIGAVAFAHIEQDPGLRVGAEVGRWDTPIGTVGSYAESTCWTGVHLHVEMVSQSNYACFNKGWHPGQPMKPTNFIGFVGGNYANGPRQPCP